MHIARVGASAVSGAGETVNVGSRGVLFTTDRRLDVGESIEYTISLPGPSGGDEGADLRCLGKILRYEGSIADPLRHVKVYVMAVTIQRHEFVRE